VRRGPVDDDHRRAPLALDPDAGRVHRRAHGLSWAPRLALRAL
jgi:hypothetical protein